MTLFATLFHHHTQTAATLRPWAVDSGGFPVSRSDSLTNIIRCRSHALIQPIHGSVPKAHNGKAKRRRDHQNKKNCRDALTLWHPPAVSVRTAASARNAEKQYSASAIDALSFPERKSERGLRHALLPHPPTHGHRRTVIDATTHRTVVTTVAPSLHRHSVAPSLHRHSTVTPLRRTRPRHATRIRVSFERVPAFIGPLWP